MSVTGKRGIGIPAILLYDAEGTIVTVETKLGDLYRGELTDTEDTMNLTMRNVQKKSAGGQEAHAEVVYIRGNQVAMIMVPDMLCKAPAFQRVTRWKEYKGNPPSLGTQEARGQAAAIIRKTQAKRRGMGVPSGPGRGRDAPRGLQHGMGRGGGMGGRGGPGIYGGGMPPRPPMMGGPRGGAGMMPPHMQHGYGMPPRGAMPGQAPGRMGAGVPGPAPGQARGQGQGPGAAQGQGYGGGGGGGWGQYGTMR